MTKCIHIFFEYPHLKCVHNFDTAFCGPACEEYIPFKSDMYDEDTEYDASKTKDVD